MKDEWKIEEGFISGGIQCFIAKWERGARPDRASARISDRGFYQYNGYCIIPPGFSLRGIVDMSQYDYLKRHLKNPNQIANYKMGYPTDYDVHGGITYRDWGYGDLQRFPRSDWVIGFDTGHYGDCEGDSGGAGFKKNRRYVVCECHRLADQIAEEIEVIL